MGLVTSKVYVEQDVLANYQCCVTWQRAFATIAVLATLSHLIWPTMWLTFFSIVGFVVTFTLGIRVENMERRGRALHKAWKRKIDTEVPCKMKVKEGFI